MAVDCRNASLPTRLGAYSSGYEFACIGCPYQLVSHTTDLRRNLRDLPVRSVTLFQTQGYEARIRTASAGEPVLHGLGFQWNVDLRRYASARGIRSEKRGYRKMAARATKLNAAGSEARSPRGPAQVVLSTFSRCKNQILPDPQSN